MYFPAIVTGISKKGKKTFFRHIYLLSFKIPLKNNNLKQNLLKIRIYMY